MDMKKTAKKIAALVAGTTMLGATIMGATALDLSNFPAPFVTNGVFSGKIVVGASAATSDVVGAIDIAASLQAEAKTTRSVEVPGAVGKATVTGDHYEFSTSNDILELGEQIGDVRTTLLDSDLEALKSGVISAGGSSTPVKQYLKFDDSGTGGGYVMYGEDPDEDVVGDFLFWADGDLIFEYQLEFTEGLESDRDGSDLEDLETESLTILGAPYTITTATTNGSSIRLEMLGGQVADVLRDGETKTFTIDGKDYEVTAVFISNSGSAKLQVNGMMTKDLDEGETEVLGGDLTIGVQSILTNNREGIVEFYLGASKLELEDNDATDSSWDTDGVSVEDKTIDEGQVKISATISSSEVIIDYIHYQLFADDDLYVPAGKGVKEFLDEPEGMLGAEWNIFYGGLMKTGSKDIRFIPVADERYELEFYNNRGAKIRLPLVSNQNGDFVWGDDDDRLVFTEPNQVTNPYDSEEVGGDPNEVEDNETFIADNWYFVLSDKESASDEKAVTTVYRYKSISTSDRTITLEELGVGDVKFSYTGNEGTTATGTIKAAGKDHTFWVGADDEIAVDLNGDGNVDGDAVPFTVQGEGYLDAAGEQVWTNKVTLSDISSGTATFTMTTPESNFDEEPGADETFDVEISAVAPDEVSLDVADGNFNVTLVDDPDDDDWQYELTDYGVFIKLYNPSSSDAEELTIEYPASQRGASVFVTAGVVDWKEGEMGESGSLTTTTLNPIAVGLAVLDKDAPALGSANMIVVGGPCANTVAAELMGNPASCAEGFTPGKAVIKMFSDKNALLVAGYSAEDTVGASQVLAAFEKYSLSGMEVEVVTADLNSLVVNKVG